MSGLRSHIILPLLGWVLTGCGAYVAPDRNVTDTLGEREVVGTWKMCSNSVALLIHDGFPANLTNRYTITFNADGTCRFQSVESFGNKDRFIAANGTWKLEHDTQGDSNIKKKNALEFELRVEGRNDNEHLNEYLNFTKENGALILWNYHSDPDLWEFIEYKRELMPDPTDAEIEAARAAQTDDIREAVFRHQFDPDGSGKPGIAKVLKVNGKWTVTKDRRTWVAGRGLQPAST